MNTTATTTIAFVIAAVAAFPVNAQSTMRMKDGEKYGCIKDANVVICWGGAVWKEEMKRLPPDPAESANFLGEHEYGARYSIAMRRLFLERCAAGEAGFCPYESDPSENLRWSYYHACRIAGYRDRIIVDRERISCRYYFPRP